MDTRSPRWTLEELTAQVALALGLDGPRQASGRVREVPDGRTIRYYATLGLVDPPAGYRGRTALYATRHLYQLVAIKRYQARGLSLAEVQQRMLGLTDKALAELALPEGERKTGRPGDEEARTHEETRTHEEDEEAFWKAEPVATSAGAEEIRSLTALPLGPGITLLAESIAPLDEQDLAALRAAAAPLLKLLAQRRLNLDSGEKHA